MTERYLERYKIVYQAYESEIKNLWQRSIFLATFMVLIWTGYGALQLAYIKNELSHHLIAYSIASIGLCLAIIVFSTLWIAMAKGSKFVQEAHEAHIKKCKIADYFKAQLNLNQIERFLSYEDAYEKQVYDSFPNF